jgi:hypothetical protein
MGYGTGYEPKDLRDVELASQPKACAYNRIRLTHIWIDCRSDGVVSCDRPQCLLFPFRRQRAAIGNLQHTSPVGTIRS